MYLVLFIDQSSFSFSLVSILFDLIIIIYFIKDADKLEPITCCNYELKQLHPDTHFTEPECPWV